MRRLTAVGAGIGAFVAAVIWLAYHQFACRVCADYRRGLSADHRRLLDVEISEGGA